MANIKNLKPIVSLSSEEAKKRGSAGGKKSVEVRREKKRMSQIYAEFLMKEHDIIGKDGIKKTVTGEKLLQGVMSKILSRGDHSAVSMMKEIREATEGNKIYMAGVEDEPPVIIQIIPATESDGENPIT